jgi:hypothetical protein
MTSNNANLMLDEPPLIVRICGLADCMYKFFHINLFKMHNYCLIDVSEKLDKRSIEKSV